jgi:Sec-independent protein translocase protein TatA
MKTLLLLVVAVLFGTTALTTYAGRDTLQMQRQKKTYECLQNDREQMQAMMDECAKMMRSGHGVMRHGEAPN